MKGMTYFKKRVEVWMVVSIAEVDLRLRIVESETVSCTNSPPSSITFGMRANGSFCLPTAVFAKACE